MASIWYFRDITEQKRAQAQILRTARSDALTGLPNRFVFIEAIQGAIVQTGRGGEGFALLYLDLDHFKDVNDTLGHPIGDELLKLAASRLLANVREGDVVARFGGDEFAVLMNGIDTLEGAAFIADRIIDALSTPYSIGSSDIRCGASIGIAFFGPEGPGAETLLSRADLALYLAKSEERGSYRFFTEAMNSEVRTRVALSVELREAIASGQLFLMYQPQVDLATGLLIGVEALVRWRHPTRGVIGPSQFIPVAERSGLIGSLGRWVMREACRQAKAWLDAGISPGSPAVNLSAIQFRRPMELEEDVVAILKETGLPPRKLELELTETVLMTASSEHNEILRRFRQKGIKLAIDDFGVGHSSLDYLRRFPVDRIKIAQVFVDQIATALGNAAIVRATIGLARELGISIIAEGIETLEQLELLKKWGCSEGQGYYFAKPLTVEDLGPLLEHRIVVGGLLASAEKVA